MNADVNDIVCVGIGSWSNINAIVTLGYNIFLVITIEGRCLTLRPNAVTADSTRKIVAYTLNSEDLSYGFEETEVS